MDPWRAPQRVGNADLMNDCLMLKQFSRTTQLIVVQPTSLCNLDCKYCYLPYRSRRNFMSRNVLTALGQNVCTSELIHPLVEVSFHSGEPLLAGLDWFEDAIHYLAGSWPAGMTASYSVQTNATLIDDKWAQLFKERKIRVSVSVDGPQHVNDYNRRNWGAWDLC